MDTTRATRRFLVADDNKLYREGLVAVLQQQEGLEVVGEASTLDQAMAVMRKHQPDVILVSSHLAGVNGSEVTATLHAEQPGCSIILLAAPGDDQALFSAIRAGARGYLLKNMPSANLVAALRAVLEGETLLFASAYGGYAEARNAIRSDCGLDQLTRQEMRVLQELSSGASNQEIARRMYVPEQMIKGAVAHILEKLNLPDRDEAVRTARQNGLRMA